MILSRLPPLRGGSGWGRRVKKPFFNRCFVFLNLQFQGFQIFQFQIGADKIYDFEVQIFSINIIVKIENIDFNSLIFNELQRRA